MTVSYKTAKSGKINIYADGEFRFAVSPVIWYSLGISEGDEIDPDGLERIKELADSAAAYEKALSLLSYRQHSESELYMKLRRSFPAEASRQAVEKCSAAGLTDDEKFASLLADELYRRKHFAPQRIIAELVNRGIDKNTAENAVLTLDIDRDSGIIEILSKMNVTADSSEKDRARAFRRLLNAGYSYHEINNFLSTGE